MWKLLEQWVIVYSQDVRSLVLHLNGAIFDDFKTRHNRSPNILRITDNR